MNKKQQLLKHYRQRKRTILLGIIFLLCLLIILAYFIPFVAYCIPLVIIAIWLGHEAWFADHLFYSAKQDYLYNFPTNTLQSTISLNDGFIKLPSSPSIITHDTIFLSVTLETSIMGYFLDPYITISTDNFIDRQEFERGVKGLRYLNLSGLAKQLTEGKVKLTSHHCNIIINELSLYAFNHPDYSQQRMMIIAPHADDAELAAFGQYSKNLATSIITLTQGEIEANYYQCTLNLSKTEAAQLKGRLRSWDSIAIPLWAKIPITQSIQLGYYCMQLQAMQKNPQQPFGSLESAENDIRLARIFNSLKVPSDKDGLPTWHNLTHDMQMLIEHFQPEVIILPHPQLDPHEDHIAASSLIDEVLTQTHWQPKTLLYYANHLHDNDRWPMGQAHNGIALPPITEPLANLALWSPVLTPQTQLNKILALGMQHDLQPPMPFKKKLRRLIQTILTGRKWPKSGENEYFRKAIRRHELFWVKPIK